MLQLFYDSIDDILDSHSYISILNKLLDNKPLSKAVIGHYPLAFTKLTFSDVESGNWHDRTVQDRWLTLPEAYVLTPQDVIFLHFQGKRLFRVEDQYPLALAYGFNKNSSSYCRDGPVFGLGYSLREIKFIDYQAPLDARIKKEEETKEEREKLQKAAVMEITVSIRDGSYFFSRKKSENTSPYTFFSITNFCISDTVLGRSNGGLEDLFYQLIKKEYQIHLSALLERSSHVNDTLRNKLAQIEE